MGSVLVEVWVDHRQLAGWVAGLACRKVRLVRRGDGTYDLAVVTTHRECAAAGLVAVVDSGEVEREAAETFGG